MTAAPAANPAAAFYGGNRIARWLGAALRATHRSRRPRHAVRAAPVLHAAAAEDAARGAPCPRLAPQRYPLEGGSFVLLAPPRTSMPPGDRPQVLLVHGWAGDAMQMRALGDALAPSRLRAAAARLPGPRPQRRLAQHLPQFVRTLFAVQARIGPLHAVVAHSLGALAATHAAAKGLRGRAARADRAVGAAGQGDPLVRARLRPRRGARAAA